MAKKQTSFIITLETNTDFKFDWARKVVISALQALQTAFSHWQKRARVDFTFSESEIVELAVRAVKK